MEQDLGRRLDKLSVDGGPTRNEVLMQAQADLLGRPVRRQGLTELSAFGAGTMAGVACGLFDEAEALARVSKSIDEIKPLMGESDRVALRKVWSSAVQALGGGARHD